MSDATDTWLGRAIRDAAAAAARDLAEREGNRRRGGRVVSTASVPKGRYELYADDDDVIGLTVARTHPSGRQAGVDHPAGRRARWRWVVKRLMN